jgi:hypothetical protein
MNEGRDACSYQSSRAASAVSGDGPSSLLPNIFHAGRTSSVPVSKRHRKMAEDRRTCLYMARGPRTELRTAREPNKRPRRDESNRGDSIHGQALRTLFRALHTSPLRTQLPTRQTLWSWRARSQRFQGTIYFSCFLPLLT